MENPSNHVQEFQFSKFSESRKKVDSQHMENSAEIIWQKKKNSLEYESKIDHRKSLAWDSAFFTNPGILDPEELFEGLNFRDVASESLEQERTKRNCEINTRRSLAWDSAFFTSAGVLDPEELCLVNKGFKKCETRLIPEIEKNIWSSAESNSLINSDSSSLASLEIDLFDDSKPSVYETSNATNVTASSCILGRENGLQNTQCMKKLDASSAVKMKSLKRQSIYKNVSERRAKVASLPPQAQAFGRGGYCSPLSAPKPPKASVQVNSPLITPSKRASSGSNNIKMESMAKKSAPGQNMIASKRPCLGKSSPKSPSLSSHTPMNKSAGLGAAKSDSASRSSQNPLSRKIDSRLLSSGSPSPYRNLHGNKIQLLNSSRPSHLLSSLESSRTSPSSSINMWSSESSASIQSKIYQLHRKSG
ncbi:hypothetical protein Pint_06109 [Pistacia integerrima]|uniref:Uncharacterized protein n=1 Tax=Pistacia integerrima TaxID=434235 RepID=A0ACC0Z3L9_9ROSI|nr:hypothetical protein Pint_06109 [Pistacia integerrima]